MSLPAIEYPRPAKMELVKEPATSQPDNKRDAFIPAWLDDLNLDPYEFRIYCRIARRGRCTESGKNMADGCKMGRNKVFECLASLEKKKLIKPDRRQGQTTAYSILPVPDEVQVPSTDEVQVPPTRTGSGTPPVPDEVHPPVPDPVHKGTPLEGTPFKVKERKTDADSVMDHVGVKIFVRVMQRTPNKTQRKAIAETVTEFSLWEDVLTTWQLHGWKKTNVAGMLDRYRAGNQDKRANGIRDKAGTTDDDRTPERYQGILIRADADE